MKALTNAEAVKQFVNDDTIDDSVLQLLINDASLRVVQDKVRTDMQEYAARLFTAHLLMVRKQSSSSAMDGVTVEKVGPIERDYSAYSRGSSTFDDPFIKEYQQLLDTLGTGDNVGRFI